MCFEVQLCFEFRFEFRETGRVSFRFENKIAVSNSTNTNLGGEGVKMYHSGSQPFSAQDPLSKLETPS
jgi:hypothetical protein